MAKVEVSEDAPAELQWNQRVVPTPADSPKADITAAWVARQVANAAGAAEGGSWPERRALSTDSGRG